MTQTVRFRVPADVRDCNLPAPWPTQPQYLQEFFLQVIRPGREDHTYLYLVPISRMSGAIHLLCLSVPPCAFTVWTKQDFVYKTYTFSALVGIYIYICFIIRNVRSITFNHLQFKDFVCSHCTERLHKGRFL